MDKLFLALSFLAVLVGFLFLSEATTVVGIIAAGGVLAVWARIAQSSAQHQQVMARLKEKVPEVARETAE